MPQTVAEQPYLLVVRDVLASLREMVALYDGTDEVLISPAVIAKVQRARAALAKAEGQS